MTAQSYSTCKKTSIKFPSTTEKWFHRSRRSALHFQWGLLIEFLRKKMIFSLHFHQQMTTDSRRSATYHTFQSRMSVSPSRAYRKTKLCTIVSGKLGRHSVSRDATIIASRLVLPARDLLHLKLFSFLYDESRLPVERTISERCSKPLNFDDQFYLDACPRRDLNHASRW